MDLKHIPAFRLKLIAGGQRWIEEYNIPMHSLWLSLSLNPGGHVHLNEPGTFSQNPLHSLPLVVDSSHSFKSTTSPDLHVSIQAKYWPCLNHFVDFAPLIPTKMYPV